MTKKELDLVKHSSAIQIVHNITLYQKKLWNSLFTFAYEEVHKHENITPEFLKGFTHEEPVEKILGAMAYTNPEKAGLDQLKEGLVGLTGTAVEWNIFNKDKSHAWGTASLLAGAEITDNKTIKWGYSPILIERLMQPKLYSRLKLSLQNDYDSLPSLAVFELCYDYKRIGVSPKMTLDEFKKFLDLTAKIYEEFKYLKQRVIMPCIRDINKQGVINIELKTFKKGRKVHWIQFKITDLSNQYTDFPYIKQPDYTSYLKKFGEDEFILIAYIQDMEAVMTGKNVENKGQYLKTSIGNLTKGEIEQFKKDTYADQEKVSNISKQLEHKDKAKRLRIEYRDLLDGQLEEYLQGHSLDTLVESFLADSKNNFVKTQFSKLKRNAEALKNEALRSALRHYVYKAINGNKLDFEAWAKKHHDFTI